VTDRLVRGADLALRKTGWAFLIAVGVSTVLHGFSFVSAAQGLGAQLSHNAGGHPAFLCGAVSPRGWWYYFPVAFLLKSTLAELLLALLGALLLLAKFLPRFRREKADAAATVWLLSGLLFGALACSSGINIGIRHVLLLYPLLTLWTLDQLGALLKGRRLLALSIGVALVVLQVSAVLGIAPRYLCYFNSLAGGPSEGYRHLVDSNLDWGQDLPALKEEVERRGYRRIVLAYFGTDDPRFYGIGHIRWEDCLASDIPGCDAVAISATHLAGVYLGDADPLQPFRELAPSGRAAYSILIYDLRCPLVEAALHRSLGARRSPDPPAGRRD
jgi:hypothetical protein